MIDKRNALKELSKAASTLMLEGKAASINDGLALIYNIQGHTEIKSFRSWFKDGFVVKKGEKALLLWGEPLKVVKQEKQKDDEKDDYKFFPLAFVFSNLQVSKL